MKYSPSYKITLLLFDLKSTLRYNWLYYWHDVSIYPVLILLYLFFNSDMDIAPMFLFHLWNFIFRASIYPNKIKPLLERIHKSYKNPSLHFRGNIYLHCQLVLIVLYPYNFQTIYKYSNIYKNNIPLFSFDEKHFI